MTHPYPLVAVKWRDARRFDSERSAREMASQPVGISVVTVGFLILDVPAGVKVASEYDTANPDELRVTWDIPRVLIEDMCALDGHKRPRKAAVKEVTNAT